MLYWMRLIREGLALHAAWLSPTLACVTPEEGGRDGQLNYLTFLHTWSHLVYVPWSLVPAKFKHSQNSYSVIPSTLILIDFSSSLTNCVITAFVIKCNHVPFSLKYLKVLCSTWVLYHFCCEVSGAKCSSKTDQGQYFTHVHPTFLNDLLSNLKGW